MAPPLVSSVSFEASGCKGRSCCPCDHADPRALHSDGALNQGFHLVSQHRNFHHACRSEDAHLRLKNDQQNRGEVPHDARSGEVPPCSRYRPGGRNVAARSSPCHPRCYRNR
jgi:hypothetical protein